MRSATLGADMPTCRARSAVVVRAYLTLVSTLHSPFAKLVKSINPSEQIGSDLHAPHLVGEMLALIFANGVRAPVQ